MSKPQRRRSRTNRDDANRIAGGVGSSPRLERSRQLLLSAAVALIVAAGAIPSEAAVFGSHVMLVLAWFMLTAVWLGCTLLSLAPCWRIGPAGIAVMLFLALHSISAVWMIGQGHGRPTLNSLWLWLAFGMMFLTVRQLVRTGQEQRAMVSVLLAMAVGFAAFGIYQTLVIYPEGRAAYAADPDSVLQQAGQYAPPGSAQRRHFEDRLASTEPTGPFALTNSLAGVLASSLILGAGLSVSIVRVCLLHRRPEDYLRLALGLAAAGVVATCLLLTKSRTGYLATLLGLAMLAAANIVPRSWLRWRWIIAGLVVLAVVGSVLTFTGGLDRQVLTEAPKSVLYRVEYWRASGAMIADYPWWGCGPGNFKEYYTHYKLPEASESIADPHNFLIEVAATAGIPALCCFLLLGTVLLWQYRSAGRPKSDAATADAQQDLAEAMPIYGGAVCGYLVAFPAGWATGHPPMLQLLWTALPSMLLVLLVLHAWVARGRVTGVLLLIAAATLLVNLLAAGGIGFPGVAGMLWVLAALALNVSETRFQGESVPLSQRRGYCTTNRTAMVVAACVVLAIAALAYWTMYRPVLAGQRLLALMNEASARSLAVQRVVEQSREAADSDPWWAWPHELLAETLHYQWMAAPSAPLLKEFKAAADAAQQQNPQSASLARRQGDWWLEMYGLSKRPDLLQDTVTAYERAVELYPNSGVLHAQLAWTLALAGERQRAAQEADRALQLDKQMPHWELKLKLQTITGSELALPGGGGVLASEGGNLEQRMQVLRRFTN